MNFDWADNLREYWIHIKFDIVGAYRQQRNNAHFIGGIVGVLVVTARAHHM